MWTASHSVRKRLCTLWAGGGPSGSTSPPAKCPRVEERLLTPLEIIEDTIPTSSADGVAGDPIVVDDTSELTSTVHPILSNEQSAATAGEGRQTPSLLTPKVESHSLLDSEPFVTPLRTGTSTTTASHSSEGGVHLSAEQHEVFDVVVRCGRSVFLTGGAGTGKSHLLRAIIDALPRRTTFTTATTGLAALNLGGITVHSFSGCGRPDPTRSTPRDVYKWVCGNRKARVRWRVCRVLIIDEISMMDAWLFDTLEHLARKMRGSRAPFGGIQLVLSGDFLQLPPVTRYSDSGRPLFCFEASSWCRVNPLVCVLTRSFRQKDEEFFAMLNEMRHGVMSNTSITLLSSRSVNTRVRQVMDAVDADAKESSRIVDSSGHTKEERYSGHTILRAVRNDVSLINEERFAELDTDIIQYTVYHSSSLAKETNRELTEEVLLRVGSRVMLTKNIDLSLGLVNGSAGTLVKFIDVSCQKDFANRSTPTDLRQISCNKSKGIKSHHLLPIVHFDNFNKDAEGKKGVSYLIEPQHWPVMHGDHEVGFSVQIPLQLAYAITIHKSQGMSLSRVNVDFHGIFAEGQAYVALSRCTNMANLMIENFDTGCVTTNPRALAYYRALDRHRRLCGSDAEKEIQRSQKGDVFCNNPWGGGDVDGDNNNDAHGECEGDDAVGMETLFTTDKDGAASNATLAVEGIRQGVAHLYAQWALHRAQVLASVSAATAVDNALLVMDFTALMAFVNTANPPALYDRLFETQNNLIRLPRVVWEVLSAGAECAVEALIEKARADLVLEVQREREHTALPPIPPSWSELQALQEENEESFGEEMEGSRERLLEYALFLSMNSGKRVLVCTESIELATCAFVAGLKICSMAYLRPPRRC